MTHSTEHRPAHYVVYFRDMGAGNWWWECACGHKDYAPSPERLEAFRDVHMANARALERREDAVNALLGGATEVDGDLLGQDNPNVWRSGRL